MGLFEFLFNRWIVLLIGIGLMFVGLLPEYTLKAVRMVGMMGWAEQSIGRGGTFSVWKIIGLLAPAFAIIYFFTPSIQFGNNTDRDQNQYQDNSGYSQDYYNNNYGY